MKKMNALILMLSLSLGLAPITRGMAAEEQPIGRIQAIQLSAPQYRPGLVRHFVAFKFRSDITRAQIGEVARRFLNLKKECVRNGRPYIQAIEVGMANSPEGADQEKQIGFLVTFTSQGDRNFYVGQPLINERFTDLYDKAHLEFKKFVGPLLATPAVPEGVFVFDFTVQKSI